MKKLFIHQPLFRLLSPIISGIIIYLLVLLLNNNVQQAQEQFFNEELYFCIALSYLIQEFSRGLLVLFKKFLSDKLSAKNIILQIVISMLLCVAISTIAITFYFEYVLGFTASKEEIYVFNSIFCTITFIYIMLYISHQYLYKINTEKLAQEEIIKQNIEDDFKQFKKGINPNLLFESFESLLILIKTDKEKSDDFIDHLATIYRYILSGKEKQLVDFNDEILIVNELIQLFNYLPYSNIAINNNCKNSFLVVPGSLLFIVEQIVRTSIISSSSKLIINFDKKENDLEISYFRNDKITTQFNLKNIAEIIRSYHIYSKQKVKVLEEKSTRKIILPKLKIIV
ncbi:histidine kinase [Polaribacter porphyrae]|uniref:Histidine kinase n=1 Tax=Polaribacter porphyrae TaxID=1137780 RepID=A0A2S7WKP2_9FLAO|nr:histidine kinase [Polaribacter porphyrae]PQJ78159.1 histidine kinase [Polaribacter porphyrae]